MKFVEVGSNIGTAAYNIGAAQASGDYFLIMGNDMEIRADAVSILVEAAKKHGAWICVPKFMNYFDRSAVDTGGNWLSRAMYGNAYKDETLGKDIQEIPYGIGLIHRSVYGEFGYLVDPEYFFYGEDVDLGLRIWLCGKKVLYVPSSIMYHMGSQTLTLQPRPHVTSLMERNLLRTFLQIASFRTLLLWGWYVFGARLVALLRDLNFGQWKNMGARVQALWWIVTHPFTLYRKRCQIQKHRRVSDKVVFGKCRLWMR